MAKALIYYNERFETLISHFKGFQTDLLWQNLWNFKDKNLKLLRQKLSFIIAKKLIFYGKMCKTLNKYEKSLIFFGIELH